MLRSAAGKIMWVGRATVFLIGVAVILALLFGVASSAFAHGGNKGFFHLGHKNVTSKVSTLIKRGAGPALNLRVGSGPPLKVNSDAKVPKLNADQIDGKDSASFLSPERIYKVEREHNPGPNTILFGGASCDQEDRAISGGFRGVATTTHVQISAASSFENTWNIQVRTFSAADPFTAQAVCMDLPPLRP